MVHLLLPRITSRTARESWALKDSYVLSPVHRQEFDWVVSEREFPSPLFQISDK